MASVLLDLGLRERVGSVLKQLGGTAQRVFGGIDANVAKTQRGLDAMGKPVKLNVDASGLKQAGDEADKLNRKLNNLGGGGGGIRSRIAGSIGIGDIALGNLAAQGVSQAARFAIGQGASVISAGMEGGAQKSQFDVMAGPKEGTPLFNSLTKYIQDSVFGNSLYGDASTLLGFGEAAKDIMPDIRMLGDVSRGNAQRMSSLSLVYGQTHAAGKLTGGDQLQFIAAGFNPLQEISAMTGKSMATLRDEMSDGKISFDMVREAFVHATSEGGRFYGMLDKIGRTSFGKWEAMKGNVEAAKMQLGTVLDRPLNRLMDVLKINVVDRLPGWMNSSAPVIERLFRQFEELLPTVKGFGSGLLEIVKPIGAMLLSDNVTTMAKKTLELGKTLTDTLKPTVDGLATSFRGLASTVGGLAWGINKLLNLRNNAAEWVNNNVNGNVSSFMTGGVPGLVHHLFRNRDEELSNVRNGSIIGKSLPGGLANNKYAQKLQGFMSGDRSALGGSNTGQKMKNASTEASDAITKGGGKDVNINFRNVVENLYNQGATKDETYQNMEAKLKEIIYRLFAGIPA